MGCVLWFGWTAYAFAYSPSHVKTWKKVIKVVAYILLSMLILGFKPTESNFLYYLVYLVFLAVIVLLIWIARGKPSDIPANSEQDEKPYSLAGELKDGLVKIGCTIVAMFGLIILLRLILRTADIQTYGVL